MSICAGTAERTEAKASASSSEIPRSPFLALTSRVLPWGKPAERPVSAIAKGTTSTGKSHTTRTVLRFFPPEAYVDLGSMSKRFLFYDEEPYSHRFVVVPEWASIADDDELVALLRTLLSEGRIVHGTVEGEGKRSARRIEKEGPTGLLVTTTEGIHGSGARDALPLASDRRHPGADATCLCGLRRARRGSVDAARL